MYSHQLEKMAERVAEKLAKKPLKTKKAICKAVLLTLQEFWKDKIAITWTIEDVKSLRSDLTDEQAIEVLNTVEHRQDADHGVNWDMIGEVIKELYGGPDEEEEEGDNELIALYKTTSTNELRAELARKEAAFKAAGGHGVELSDQIAAMRRVLEIRENELPEKEDDSETSLEFLGPSDTPAEPPTEATTETLPSMNSADMSGDDATNV